MNRRQFFLDTLDGFAFEDLCADIYKSIGYRVEQTQYVADEGRDLILTDKFGSVIVAECKHYPNRTVGRPIVQRLHSAVLSYPAKQGLIITTGSFTQTARDYASNLQEPIELVDGTELAAMASQVGIDLLGGGKTGIILAVQPTTRTDLETRLNNKLFNWFISSPSKPSAVLTLESFSTSANLIYRLQYSIKQNYEASGQLLYQIDVSNYYLYIDGQSMEVLDSRKSDFIHRATPVVYDPESPSFRETRINPFQVSPKQITDNAQNLISQIYSRRLSYEDGRGKERVRDFTPSLRNIQITDMSQMYVPETRLGYRAIQNTYQISVMDNGHDLIWFDSSGFFTCSICDSEIESQMLCNSCGAISHSPSFVTPHSFRCTSCDKSICKNCAYWIPKWKVFKSIVCYECGTDYRVLELRTVNKLVR